MKTITKKYKIIILGDQFSGKSYLISKLKNKNNTNSKSNLLFNYYPTTGVNFYKHYTSAILNKIINQNEKHINLLYLYDASGNKNKLQITKNYIKECQICLIVINQNNYHFYSDRTNRNKELLKLLNFGSIYL